MFFMWNYLIFEKLIDLYLSPNKIRLLIMFLNNLPPKSSPYYTFNQH
jgi:hypothetical protein